MHNDLTHGRTAKYVSALAAMVLLTIGVSSCGWFSAEDSEEPATSQAAPTIAVVEGMKYYVGGPVMTQDRFGAMRMRGFNGEVRKPTGRGLVIGFKTLDDKRFEMQTLLNGKVITKQRGFLDDMGLLWFDEILTVNADGVTVVRQVLTYDDERQITRSKIDYLDPVDGEVIKTHDAELPYVTEGDDEEDLEGEDGEEGEEETGEPEEE